jgi:sulfate adenylyltransferase
MLNCTIPFLPLLRSGSNRGTHQTASAPQQVEANLLIHPSVGMTKPGDVDYFVRTRCYQLLLSKYPHGTVKLSMLPAMRPGGP